MRTRRWAAASFVSLFLVTLLVLDHSSAAFRGTTGSSGNQWAADQLQPPGTPTATYSCSLATRRITVAWSASPSTFANQYQVTRSVNGGAYAFAANVAFGTNSWVDTNVNGSTSYAYKVRTDRTGWSWVSATTAASNTVNTPALCI